MHRQWLLISALLLLIAGCGGGQDDSGAAGTGKIKITATTGQVADLARNIGGPLVEVTALMGSGIDPHLYKASARDVERLRGADLILYNGLHLEAKMGEVLERMGDKPTLAVAETLDPSRLISPEEYTGSHDPHVWFDVALWAEAIPVVVEQISALAPQHAAEFQQRGDQYAARLAEMHAHALATLGQVPEQQRVMITAHDAFNYFGRAYGLEVRGLQGISTATEAGTRDVQDLAAFISENRIPALFVETSVSPRTINAVKEAVAARGFDVQIGGEIYSDALGDAGTPAGTYLGMVRHNVDVIAAALQGRKAAGHE